MQWNKNVIMMLSICAMLFASGCTTRCEVKVPELTGKCVYDLYKLHAVTVTTLEGCSNVKVIRDNGK